MHQDDEFEQVAAATAPLQSGTADDLRPAVLVATTETDQGVHAGLARAAVVVGLKQNTQAVRAITDVQEAQVGYSQASMVAEVPSVSESRPGQSTVAPPPAGRWALRAVSSLVCVSMVMLLLMLVLLVVVVGGGDCDG